MISVVGIFSVLNTPAKLICSTAYSFEIVYLTIKKSSIFMHTNNYTLKGIPSGIFKLCGHTV